MHSRRDILKRVSAGFGYLAFAGISSAQAMEEQKSTNPLADNYCLCCIQNFLLN